MSPSASAKDYKANTGARARSDLSANPRGDRLAHADTPLTDAELFSAGVFLDGASRSGGVFLPELLCGRLVRVICEILNRGGGVDAR